MWNNKRKLSAHPFIVACISGYCMGEDGKGMLDMYVIVKNICFGVIVFMGVFHTEIKNKAVRMKLSFVTPKNNNENRN